MKIEILCLMAFGFTVFVQTQTQSIHTPSVKSPTVQVFVDKKDVEKVVKDIMKERQDENAK